MKQIFLSTLLLFSLSLFAQKKPFRFAFISDTHIGSPNGGADEDLRRTVADINAMSDVDFVVLTGDITELGTNAELALAKQILDSLDIPYYIIPGNHDTGWSESGGLSFTKTFGDDKFYFRHNGIHFIGCASGPYVRMSDGHVPRHAVNWMKDKLKKIGNKEPIVFLNHYPLDNGLDNWYEIIDMLKEKNTILALCGHGHNNRPVKAEDIPAIMGRSNLRAKAAEGGYNMVDVRQDSILFTERKPVSNEEKKWAGVAVRLQQYNKAQSFPRPDFSINGQYPQTKAAWTYHSAANVISTPAVVGNLVVFGNQNGTIEALGLEKGNRKWTFKTGGPIFSSPAFAATNGDTKIVVGSADGAVYCLNKSGKQVWKATTDAAVLGSPLIDGHVVYVGGSDHSFRALDLATGNERWRFSELNGPVVSKPVVYKDAIVFGAWDRNLYALDKETGSLLWKWSNGSPVINYSPAACIPVIKDDVVYVVAPDRYLSAIDFTTGKTLWRTKEATVRESMGVSEDGRYIYGKTMQDTVVAFVANKENPQLAWKMHAGFGYEHAPSMLIEKEGTVFFGTRNGVVYAIDPTAQKITWAHKIDNSMVNTVNVLDGKRLIAATMDGKVCLLQAQ
ncbi:MAG TPA: PQQ-binding-like beta-propeller repeat protein [Flavisolibacter sp.]|jgi:outer membrane protein assembly factor BamB|nr:PQQ-binding-like beta-propeller repeat protein [Flavisolibacter sp.]